MHVLIVGGGAAGLSAANAILSAGGGHTVTLFEAHDRLGGRARTNNSLGYAFDMGAQYIQDPDENPWTNIAAELGFELVEDDPTGWLRIFLEGAWQTRFAGAVPGVNEVVEGIETSYEAAKGHANEVVSPRPAEFTVDQLLGAGTSPYGPFSESAETWQYLAADRARMVERDAGLNKLVPKGVGTLVDAWGQSLEKTFGARLTVHRQTPVGKIRQDGGRAIVQAGEVVVEGDACIVTVSVSVLAAESITFDPALPKGIVDAVGTLAARGPLRLGSYKKLAVVLANDPETIEPGNDYYLANADPPGVWQYYRLGYARGVLVTHTAGDFTAALDQAADHDIVELFRTALQQAYPENGPILGDKWAVTQWSKDPYVRGAYSYTAPGSGGKDDPAALNARIELAKPFQRVFFAGEGTSVHDYGTLSGAYDLGVRAAVEALELA